MKNNAVILIVTGMPRSGTSLIMQIMKILNYPIIGYKFPLLNKYKKVKNNISSENFKKIKKYINGNPRGYYELPKITLPEVEYCDIIKYRGSVIKIPIDKILFSNFINFIPKYRDKLIYCLRNPVQTINSQNNLDPPIDNNEIKKRFMRYIYILNEICEVLVQKKIREKDFLIIDYDNLIENSQESLKQIIKFINIPLNDSMIQDAKNNITKNLRRASQKWPINNDIIDIALNMYKSFQKYNFGKVNQIYLENNLDKNTLINTKKEFNWYN
ncbi:sulfotransferase domain-containing protein [Candidatus Falkowbacteria bacterium]|nr:sulfotransferase domain-containing protein [Candidatus Falkowbacteria bacterium]